MSEAKDEQETVVAQTRAEVRSQTRPVVASLLRLFYIVLVEAAIEQLVRFLQNHVFHKLLPRFVHEILFWAGIGILVVYIVQHLLLHGVRTYVDTRLEARQELGRLEEQTKKDKNV